MLTLLAVFVAASIGLSPIALGAVRGISDDWEGLSLIGQTYGAASALLAGLALLGVVATLVLQARETRISRELALRDSNSELLRMAMESPEYARCWGANLPMTDPAAQRQSMYTNMIISQWEMAYDSRAIGDEHVRALAGNLFAGRVGWEFWGRVRAVRLRTADTRRARRFHRILDEEFQRAAEPPPEDGAGAGTGGGGRRVMWVALGAGLVGVGGVAAAVAAARHRSRAATAAPVERRDEREGPARRR
nr:DUF6082 family protein [Streptomonospora sp. PA3]